MIRPARPADRPAVSRLQSLLPEPSPTLLDHALRTGAGARLLVSTNEDGVGDGSGRPPGRPVGYLLAVEGPSVHVAELVVAPTVRRAGRASELLASLAASLDRGTRLTVAVEPDNDAARSLYRSSGFRPVETLPDYFERGPAILLAGVAGDVSGDDGGDGRVDGECAGDDGDSVATHGDEPVDAADDATGDG